MPAAAASAGAARMSPRTTPRSVSPCVRTPQQAAVAGMTRTGFERARSSEIRAATIGSHVSSILSSIWSRKVESVRRAESRVAAKLAFCEKNASAREKPAVRELGEAESSPRNISTRRDRAVTVWKCSS